MSNGYPWMDTLAHEMTHLALGRGTIDRAPLWLQEGVAKYEETRWRARDQFDDQPSADSVAAVGYDKGLALEFNNLGPSVAMLPSPQQAMVVFAEVQSFMSYWIHEAGEHALPKLIEGLGTSPGDREVGEVFREVSQRSLGEWSDKWKQHLEKASRDLPEEIDLGGGSRPDASKLMRSGRLGAMLLEDGFNAEARSALENARQIAPRDLRIRFWLGKANLGLGREEEAFEQVQKVELGASPDALALALRGYLFVHKGDQATAEASFLKAISLDPWDQNVACRWLSPPNVPTEALLASLCEASRRWPRN